MHSFHARFDCFVYFARNYRISELMEWSDDTVIWFVQDIENSPVLWDPNDPHYTTKRIKNEAWANLGAKYNADPDELKRKWNSLQASYRRERAKVRNGKGSSWFAYEPMYFLGMGMETRKGPTAEKEETQGTTFSEESNQNDIEIYTPSDVEMYTPQVTLTTPLTRNNNAASGSIVPSGTSLQHLSLTQGTQTSSKRRRNSSETEEASVNDRQLQEDQFEAAGKNFIAKLKILTKTQRILAERLIYDVLLEAEMGTLTRTSKLQI